MPRLQRNTTAMTEVVIAVSVCLCLRIHVCRNVCM